MERVLVLCLAAVCFVVVPGCGKDPKDFPVESLNSVVQVGYLGAFDESKDIKWICSGAIVEHRDNETRILTAKHCSCDPDTDVAYGGKAFVRYWSTEHQEWSAAIEVERRVDHTDRDVSVLVVKGRFGGEVPVACRRAQLYTRCFNIGVSFFTGGIPNPTEGMISSTTVQFDPNGELVSTAPIVPGYSGGALLGWCEDHGRWEVVGVNSKVIVPSYGAAYHIAIAVPVYDVLEWVFLSE